MAKQNPTVIHWFRKGQRIHDNPSLIKAIDLVNQNPGTVLRPIFMLDPNLPKWMKVGPNRFRFLFQSLEELNENLIKINSRLYVVRGIPKETFPKLFKEWNVSHLTFESDIEPYAVERDQMINDLAKKHNVKVYEEHSHTIYHPDLIFQKNLGKPVTTYQKFISIIEKIPVPDPLPSPASKLKTSTIPKHDENEKNDKNCYDPPKLNDLDIDLTELGPNLFPGGENEALKRMETHLKEIKWICSFEKPNTSPNSIKPSTTVLSPYLKFGCLSSRLFYKKLKEVIKNRNHSQPPVSLIGQLIWREFYYAVAAVTPNFDKMKGNSVCYQIPWNKNDLHLNAWRNGQTGYPFIDAIMRQLKQEGWIHHLARHAVACFLTRGDLWISWEEGQKVFEEFLLDADWALNAGNWMWLSASAFFHQFFRVYSPVAFGKKTDPDGSYIKKYCPELKNYPANLIYEPWKATLKIQQSYGCVIGKDYPNRIIIHEDVYKENISKMAAAYKLNKKEREASSSVDLNKSIDSSVKKRKASPKASSSTNKKRSTLNKSQSISKYFDKKK